jgi:putative transposase
MGMRVNIARTYMGQKKNCASIIILGTGLFRFNTVGTDEEVVRAYIRDQEKEDHRIEQLSLFCRRPPNGGQ